MKCSNCGYDKILNNFKYCPLCGTALVSKKTNKNKTVDQVNTKEEKKLNPKTIYGILFGSVLVIFMILYISGVFDQPKLPQSQNMNFNSNQMNNSGVDLSAVQKINELEAKVKSNPNDHQTLLELAHLRMDSGFYEQAIQNYKTYLEHHPDDADVRVDMGVCYFNLKDFDTALKEMEKALQYNPKHQIAHLNLGVVNLNMGNLEKAKEWFRKTVELNPNTDAAKRAQQLLTTH